MKKKNIIVAFAVILATCQISTSCSSKKEQTKDQRTSTEEIAPATEGYEQVPEEIEEESTSSDGALTGLYRVGDKNSVWFIQLNDDETARAWRQDSPEDIKYGSWDKSLIDDDRIRLDIDGFDFNFKNEQGNVLNSEDAFGYAGVIKGGWFYLDSDAVKAKNPTKRIKIKKIK